MDSSRSQGGEAKLALALEVRQTDDRCPEHCESVLLIMVVVLVVRWSSINYLLLNLSAFESFFLSQAR